MISKLPTHRITELFDHYMPDGTLHLLVVDDEECVHDSVQLLFEDEPRIRVDGAPSLAETRRHLDIVKYWLVLLDIHLPDGDGLDHIYQIRERQPETYVVPLTVEGHRSYIARRGWCSPDGWVVKGRFPSENLIPEMIRILKEYFGDGRQFLCLPSAVTGVWFRLHPSDRGLSQTEISFLKTVVRFLPKSTRGETRKAALGQLDRVTTNVDQVVAGSGFKTYAELQREFNLALALAWQWIEPERSLTHLAEVCGDYSENGLRRAIRKEFGLSLKAVSKVDRRPVLHLPATTKITIRRTPEGKTPRLWIDIDLRRDITRVRKGGDYWLAPGRL